MACNFLLPISQAGKTSQMPCPMEILRVSSLASHPSSAFVSPTPIVPQQLEVSSHGYLEINPSPLHPDCKANKWIFLWKGVNLPPANVINAPVLQFLANLAPRSSIQDASSYGSGLRKFHVFCDIFTIPKVDQLPASFPLLHSFALWAIMDPSLLDQEIFKPTQFEPISDNVVQTYLTSICTWHIAQGWQDHDWIKWLLWGLVNIQGQHRHPARLPITIHMLHALKATLDLNDPFNACIWAICACAFFGIGETMVKSRLAFNGS